MKRSDLRAMIQEEIERQTQLKINEGVYDPSVLKAIFLAGGPGSGKSYVTSKVTGGMGFKVVNSDAAFELFLKKANIGGKGMDISAFTPSEYDEAMEFRTDAKRVTKSFESGYTGGRLGVIIDGTGKDYGKISKQRSKLDSLGYDTYMIFVNTTLATALERNQMRARTVPEKIVKDSWLAVQSNLGKFQSLFGRNQISIVDGETTTDKVFMKLWKVIKQFSTQKVKNSIGRSLIDSQLSSKNRFS
jgi:cytidylate kinase